MSIFEIYNSGVLDKFIELGIVKQSIVDYCRITREYYKHRQSGMNYTQAVIATSETMCVAEITVRRAVATVI